MSDNEREMEPDDLDEPMNEDAAEAQEDTYVPIGDPDENGVPVPKNERITVRKEHLSTIYRQIYVQFIDTLYRLVKLSTLNICKIIIKAIYLV